jgi:2-iminobutanoate/2-iminopropanoate deaminase
MSRKWEPVSMPDGVPPPAGAYSRAVRAGNLIFVSGQVPRDFESGALRGDDIASQTRATLDNLRRVLGAAGATLDDVVSVSVHLQNASDWAAFDEVYRATFSAPYPTRTVVGAALRGILVEITAVAAVRA